MDKIPMEWVDKIFNCMLEFYGERWSKCFDRFYPEPIAKTLWQSALQGCSYDDIRGALVLLKQNASMASEMPPDYLEFWRYAKRLSCPKLHEHGQHIKAGNPEIARAALSEIKEKLGGKKRGDA